MIYELVLQNFDCSLEFVFFSAVTSAFQLFTRKLCLQFSGLRMRNITWNRFPIKICWSIPCIHPSWKVYTWPLRWCHTHHITECDVCDQFTLVFMSNLNSKKIIHVMNVFSGSKLKIILNILKKYPVKLFQRT